MSEPNDNAAQRAWQSQATTAGAGRVREVIQQSLNERRRRTRSFRVSAAIIVPGWIAAFWLYPDLRPVATVGLGVAAWLSWHMHRRNPSAATPPAVHVPCLSFEIAQLSREREFYRTMPRWFFSAVIAGQVAIVVTLLANPRFEKNGMFAGSLSLFIITVVAVLTFAYRRSRRMVADLDREIALLGVAGTRIE